MLMGVAVVSMSPQKPMVESEEQARYGWQESYGHTPDLDTNSYVPVAEPP
jgi:hypothetical protein